MLWPVLLSLITFSNCQFPVYFSSFEDLGAPESVSDVLPLEDVDHKLAKYTKNCPADAFLLIDDENPYEKNLDEIKNLARQSYTRASYLSDQVFDVRDFALDLTDYCDAEFVKVDPEELDLVEQYLDTKPRVFYVHFVKGLPYFLKSDTLHKILSVIPTPFITTIYTSHVQHPKPLLEGIKLDERRDGWQRRKLRRDDRRIAPIIAPLMGSRPAHPASRKEPTVDLPDHFFTSLFIGSVFFVGFLAYRDFKKSKTTKVAQKDLNSSSKKDKLV